MHADFYSFSFYFGRIVLFVIISIVKGMSLNVHSDSWFSLFVSLWILVFVKPFWLGYIYTYMYMHMFYILEFEWLLGIILSQVD